MVVYTVQWKHVEAKKWNDFKKPKRFKSIAEAQDFIAREQPQDSGFIEYRIFALDEQEENDRFVRMVRGVKRADRLQQIWKMTFGDTNREETFRRNAKGEGYTDKQVDAFLSLP